MAWTTPKTWAADELLTASDLNQYLSDNLSALYALTQGGGRKNLLHNGAFQVAQRSVSVASISSAASAYYTADRWAVDVANLGTWTQSVENDAPTGSGWRKSLKMLCSSADASPATTDTVKVFQAIEGQNLQSVLKGTTSAQQLTLSFWTKSNKTGTYIVELYDNDNNRHCSKSYTVTSSATWEEQSVTFPADLTGAFDNDTAGSLYVYFHLAEGPSQTSGTLATAWASYTAANQAVGQTNLGASNSNYWQVTGVQLEVGSAATGYEFKNYGTELAECQRYYAVLASGTGKTLAHGYAMSSTRVWWTMTTPVTMRVTPTALTTIDGTSYWGFNVAGSVDLFNSVSLDTAQSTPYVAVFYNTQTSEISQTGGVSGMIGTNSSACVLGVSADI